MSEAKKWTDKGKKYNDNGDYDKAINAYKHALKINPRYDVAWFRLGYAYSKIDLYDKSIEAYKHAIDIDPKDKYSWFNMGIDYYNKKDYERAIYSYKRGLEIDPKNNSALRRLGDIYKKKKDYNKAIECYEKSTLLDLKNRETWVSLGEVYIDTKRYNDAIQAFKEALKIDPKNKSVWNYLGIIYRKKGKFDKSINAYKSAIQIDSEFDVAWSNLGRSYDSIKEYDKAIKSYKRALEINPENKVAFNNLALAYISKRDYDKAIEIYKHIIKVEPKCKINWNNLGVAYGKKRKYDEAIEAYKHVIEIDPNFKKAWNNLGIAYKNKGKYEKAIKSYKRAVEIDPNYERAWKNLNVAYENKPLKSFKVGEIEILRGGDWKVKENQSVFYYKVKVKNNSRLVISNIQILITSKPKGLSLKSDRYKIHSLNPNSFESPTFKFLAKESCVGNIVEGVVLFIDPSGKLHTIPIKPFEVKYVCNLLVKKKVSKEEFDQKIINMEGKKLTLDCQGQLEEIENSIYSVLENNNFFILDPSPDSYGENYRMIHGYAQGKYDKKDVALSIIMQKLEEHTQLIIKAMSDEKAKLTDILRDISFQCNDIKTDTALIKDYTSQIEEVFDRIDDLESFLINNLGGDFTKIKYVWQQYKAGEITRKELIKEGLKLIGKHFAKIFIKKIIPI